MKLLRILLGLVSALVALSAYSADKDRPDWTRGVHRDFENSYIKVEWADGNTREAARKAAAQQIVNARSMETGIQTEIYVRPDGYIESTGHDVLQVKARVIDEYFEEIGGGRSRVWLLAQVANHPLATFEKAEVSDRYSFSGRVFVPGMAQIYKGSTAKGAVIIGAEILSVGGIVLGECMRSSYISKMNSTHNASHLKTYSDKANTWSNVRNASIGVAAAVYVWNVVDGIVAKGKKHVKVDGKDIAFVPYYDYESAGLAFCITF